VLGPKWDDPVVVLGEEKRFESEGEFNAVKALVQAGRQRLRGSDLNDKSGLSDARKYLEVLRDRDANWKKVLSFPEGTWGKGYGLTFPGVPEL
jgi:hypothetical protein